MTAKFVLVIDIVLFSGSLSLIWPPTIKSILKTRSVFTANGGISESLMESIASGTELAINHCQKEFFWDRWNCPQTIFSRLSKEAATKETAYSKAILAAGIAHAITRNCSRGELKSCGCKKDMFDDVPTNITKETTLKETEKFRTEGRDWMWGGCSDDTSFGIEVSKSFLDGEEKGTDVQAFVERHNYDVGRKVVEKMMVRRCRCHGVSGSCTVQTCWLQMVPFSEVARKLKEKYHRALKISFDQVDGALFLGNSVRPVKTVLGDTNALVFLEPSPDYCKENAAVDWPGTKGRKCSKTNLETATPAERKSCRNLCRSCGLKVRKTKRKVVERCNCSFVWCCEVKCETCTSNVEEFFCD